jgi:hypothetical protein
MIEVVHPETPEPIVPLLVFMRDMIASLLTIGEEVMAFLASRHVQAGWEDRVFVADFPEDKRRHPHVRFYYAVDMAGTLMPIG